MTEIIDNRLSAISQGRNNIYMELRLIELAWVTRGHFSFKWKNPFSKNQSMKLNTICKFT